MATFSGKVALVTGGGSGIGRATALAFAQAGAKVVVADIAVQGGEGTAAMIAEAGGEAYFIRTDVTQAAQVAALIEQTVARYGRLDCAHNNAGIEGERSDTVSCTEENWDRILNVNLKGVWLCLKYEIPQMQQQGGGAIVNTASAAGLIGAPKLAAYSAAKGGVVQLTRTAALEVAAEGIRVNAVCPAFIYTPMTAPALDRKPDLAAKLAAVHPVKRLGTPEEVAAAVLWLCSEAASFVTGHAMAVDGGLVVQ